MKNEENFINSLKIGEKALMDRPFRGECSGVPQVALLIKHKDQNIVGKAYVNTKIGNKLNNQSCMEEWQTSEELSHAEAQVFYHHGEYIKNSHEEFDLIVSSHPCENCIKSLLEYESEIKNVFFISKSSYVHKRELYDQMASKNKLKKFEDININFEVFNTFDNEEINNIISYYNSRLNDYLSNQMKSKIFDEILLSGKSEVNITLDKKVFKNLIFYFEIMCDALEKRIYTVKGETVKIQTKQIFENKSKIIKYMNKM